jgi:tetratricopeptide (TPR) repeat protein
MKKHIGRKRRALDSAHKAELKEDLLRPNPYLGYNREILADHFMKKEAFGLAEEQYRRMIWLNPDEPRFQAKLVRCLITQGRRKEATQFIEAAVRFFPERRDFVVLAKLLKQKQE